jgi:alginate O-acetyltransferase complex protein AlgI
MFSIQIYYDFSGYSDMAIGLGRMFGFHFLENFNYPYISKSVSDFWRRWHMSLGSFFRDYLYIPLGGNRKRMYLNLLIVWFLTGLWHGASWNFILWGLYFGLFIAIEKLFLKKLLDKLPSFISNIYLILLVIVGWVLFYFTDLSKAIMHLKIMFFAGGVPISDTAVFATIMNNLFWIILSIIFCMPVVKIFTNFSEKLEKSSKRGLYLSYGGRFIISAIGLVLSSMLLVGQSYNPFF